MLLKSGFRENFGGIKISSAKKMIRLKRAARNLQWGVFFGGRSKIVYIFDKN